MWSLDSSFIRSSYGEAYEPFELFGFCASQSGAFFPRYSQVIRMVEAGPPRHIRYYLDWGSYETDIARSNEEMREAILGGGHELECHVYPEGHSWGSWRAHVDDILRDFAGRAGRSG